MTYAQPMSYDEAYARLGAPRHPRHAQTQHQTGVARASGGVAFLCWLACLVGFCGIHRFYTGRWVTGIIWLLTGGLLLIGQIVDLFLVKDMARRPKW